MLYFYLEIVRVTHFVRTDSPEGQKQKEENIKLNFIMNQLVPLFSLY